MEHKYDQDVLMERGLCFCIICKGAESSLTKECCGMVLDEMVQNLITAGKTDFINGMWINYLKPLTSKQDYKQKLKAFDADMTDSEADEITNERFDD